MNAERRRRRRWGGLHTSVAIAVVSPVAAAAPHPTSCRAEHAHTHTHTHTRIHTGSCREDLCVRRPFVRTCVCTPPSPLKRMMRQKQNIFLNVINQPNRTQTQTNRPYKQTGKRAQKRRALLHVHSIVVCHSFLYRCTYATQHSSIQKQKTF